MAAQDELALLDRVFLRIGSAETDDQLQNSVSKFLPPVILKLSSQQDGVRKKVMELLIHINKRIKSRPKIQLPVEALLLQYQDPAATSFVTNFTIIYIKLGYPRLEMSKQAELVPCLLNSMEGKPQAQQDSLLLMVMPVLGHIKVTSDIEKRKTLFGLSEKPKTVKLLLDFMLDMLLLPYGLTSQILSKSANQGNNESPNGVPTAPPGLSDYSFKRLTAENALNPEQLEEAKLGIVKFIGLGVLPENEVVIHLIVASSDTRHSVANASDLELKRNACVDNMSNSTISQLYSLFLGTVFVKDQTPVVKPEFKRTPANTRIRMKIMAHLLKCREAASYFPACIQVIFDCLYGTITNAKLKVMAVQLVHNVCDSCSESRLVPIGPVLISGMIKLIAEAEDDSKLRSLAYVAIGKLGNKLPQLVSKDIALVQTFFTALQQEDQNTRLAVLETLSMLLPSFTKLDQSNRTLMEALLLSNVEKSESQVRLLAVQYAGTVFSQDNITSRFILLLAAGDIKDDVRTTALKFLKPNASIAKKVENMDRNIYPPFTELMNFINEKATERMKSNQKYSAGNITLPFNPNTMSQILEYLRLSLAHSAGVTVNYDALKEQGPLMAPYVRKLLSTGGGDKNPINLYINALRQLISATGNTQAMYLLLEIVAIVPDILTSSLVNHLDWIKGFMFSSKEQMREYACELYVIVLINSSNESKFFDAVKELTKAVKDRKLETQHGAILALGFAVGKKIQKKNVQVNDIIYDATSAIVDVLNDSQSLLTSAACSALGEIGRNGTLPIKNGSVSSVLEQLILLVKNSKPNNKVVREKASLAAGYVCVSINDDEMNLLVLKRLLETSNEIKDVDVQYTIGDSLVNAVLGPLSPIAKDTWSINEKEVISKTDQEPKHLAWLVDELLKYGSSLNPNIAQAGCIWMVSLLMKCHVFPSVISRLEQIQTFFIGLLSENNDLVQDLAAKGLGVVYEYSAEELRSNLVTTLLETLTTGKKPKQVSDDTKIFEEGSANVGGGNLTTYKELCSFASDLNQPDLVYKFMHLSKHNAMWNSKRGAAFGFGTIASQAGEQLTPYLPKIVPRLYRYQFDPNVKIQQSMMSIWHALVPDPIKTVNKYLKEILSDIASNLTNVLWRVRESCCLALADLLRGRQLESVVSDLPPIMETCFRVRDDIKESVRLAADIALKALSKVAIKMSDLTSGKRNSEEAVALFLPTLLKSGITSPVSEVRAISLSTVVKMSKQAGPLLKPHLSILLVALLESLSTMEPSSLNYFSVRFSTEESMQESLDLARIDSYKDSPMMGTINYCIQFIDSEVLESLIPRIIDLIRHTVGLGTKAGCAQFLCTLVTQCPRDLEPHSGKLLSALLNGLNDRNAAVRRQYATVIGHIVRCAKSSSVEKLILKLKSWYIEKEEENVKNSCGATLYAIAKHSPDILKEHAVSALPLAFLAMHSTKMQDGRPGEESKSSVWEDVWFEGTPGTEGGIRIYIVEIVELATTALSSQSWLMKAQGAMTMRTVANKLGSSMSTEHARLLLEALFAGLVGRTWTGKEAILKAIEAVCVNCKDALLEVKDGMQLNEIINNVLRECRKDNVLYKQHALRCLSAILNTFQEDRFKEVIEICKPIITQSENDDSEREEKEMKVKLKEIALEAIGQSWPKKRETQEQYQKEVCDLLVSSVNNNVWKVQLIIIKSLGTYVERLELLEDSELSADEEETLKDIISKISETLCTCVGVAKHGSLRSEAVNVTEVLLTKLKDKNRLHLIQSHTKNNLQQSLNNLSQDSMPDLQVKADFLKRLVNE